MSWLNEAMESQSFEELKPLPKPKFEELFWSRGSASALECATAPVTLRINLRCLDLFETIRAALSNAREGREALPCKQGEKRWQL
jgi:hypothetical protein